MVNVISVESDGRQTLRLLSLLENGNIKKQS
jgi:hypothetical protein